MSKKETPKGPEKDVELKPFSRKVIEEQINQSAAIIADLQVRLTQTQRDIEQNTGVLNYSKFLLAKYALADEKPADPKKPELEVK